MKRSSTCGKVGVEGSSTGGSIRSDDHDVKILRSGRKVTAPKPQQTSIDYPRDIASEVGPAQTMTESLTPLHPTRPPEKSSRPRLKRSSTNFCGKLEPRGAKSKPKRPLEVDDLLSFQNACTPNTFEIARPNPDPQPGTIKRPKPTAKDIEPAKVVVPARSQLATPPPAVDRSESRIKRSSTPSKLESKAIKTDAEVSPPVDDFINLHGGRNPRSSTIGRAKEAGKDVEPAEVVNKNDEHTIVVSAPLYVGRRPGSLPLAVLTVSPSDIPPSPEPIVSDA